MTLKKLISVAASLLICCAATVSPILPAVPAADAADEMVVFQESKPLMTRAGAWQSWGDRIHLQPGQERLPVRLVFTNGADGKPRVTGMNAELHRAPLATFESFNGGDSFSIDLTGRLHAGYNPITVKAFGPSGARMNWKLFIQRPVILSVSPQPISLKDTVTVQGSNFSDRAQQVMVHIGHKHVHALTSKAGELTFRLPDNAPGGSQSLQVAVASVRSRPYSVMVRSSPHITRVSMLASPPQHPVTLEGYGFSPVAAENIVTFRGIKATVTASTDSTITCIIPDMHFPDWHVPIKVVTNGMPSKGKAYINVDMRVIDNEGVPMH